MGAVLDTASVAAATAGLMALLATLAFTWRPREAALAGLDLWALAALLQGLGHLAPLWLALAVGLVLLRQRLASRPAPAQAS